MKKIFLVASVVVLTWTGGVFAAERGSGLSFTKAEFDRSITAFDVDTAKLNTLKKEVFDNILPEDGSMDIVQLVVDISNNDEFISYLESKLENIFDALTDFVLNNPAVRKNFEEKYLDENGNLVQDFADEDGNLDREKIKNFFKSYITLDDIVNCLLLSVVDADISNIEVGDNVEDFMDNVYIELEKILNKENLNDLLNVIYEEVVNTDNENKAYDIHNIIYNEVKDIVDTNNISSLFEDIYNTVVDSINSKSA